jgi:RNA polymerase sigma-70 factor (ECF subfamily)
MRECSYNETLDGSAAENREEEQRRAGHRAGFWMSDHAKLLLTQARAGDLAARQKLLLRHHPELLRLIRADLPARLRAVLDPEDVLQEVYVSLLGSFDSFSGADLNTLRHWLQTVARNKVREIRRRQLEAAKRGAGRERQRFSGRFSQASAPLAAVLEAHMTSVSGKAVRIEALDSLAAALAMLPTHYREVLELRYLLGMTVDDVAQRTNRSRGSVLMISHRAKQQAAELIRQFPLLTKS